ncbi:uncharacterized protein FSUBG_12947 [Fusarium subglutinans]|uniref:Uncharacterized protein n=1 Tax=Gibberella subglutinans TaxID=42677 RepID=A0A8H5L544_GIBSU|nr:uncharacterized protein FSUBG_12947 [Fusarium subglutinans]KAF5583940.1 hypothetical protein FSUBG_12947 [Fusarium subglutinans]
MAAAALQAAGTIIKIAVSLIEEHQADSAAQDRQNQIMSALNGIQDILQSIQIQQENLADIEMLHSSPTLIETWRTGYPPAVQNNDIDQINSYLQAFNIKGEGGAEYIGQNIFDVLTGQGQAAPGQPGATPLVQVWHDQSYDKMYTPDDNGQYTFTLKDYLDDFDKALGWAFSRAGFALICQIIALQDLADKATTPEEIENEVRQFTGQFTANVNHVFNMAYEQFPPFVKKFKLSYQDEGSNLTNWFRMWRNNSHVRNYNPIAGGPNPMRVFGQGLYPGNVFEVYPEACDDAEGIYPEVEFRFGETNHPLKGLATIHSRAGGFPLLVYNIDGRKGLTTARGPIAPGPWATYNVSQVSQVAFNVLPVSTKYSNTDAPAFVLLLSQGIDTQGWAWDIGSASPLAYWILRDDGATQSTWVRWFGGSAMPPGQQSKVATGPNPVDDGQHPSHWIADD